MGLKEQLLADMKEAMKAKSTIALGVIRMVRSSITYAEKMSGKELSEADIIQIISKEVKSLKDACSEYAKAGREDLVGEANAQIDVLSGYLPQQLSESEIRVVVEQVIDELGAVTSKDLGRVMKPVLSRLAGRADGKLVNGIVKEMLEAKGS
jgi:uncharacterized protein YqeY